MIDKFNLSRITKLIGTLLVLSPLLFSQVVIKDSIKITPKMRELDSLHSRELSLQRQYLPPDLPVKFHVFAGATIKVNFGYVRSNATIGAIVMRQPSNQTIFTPEQFIDGEVWTSEKITQETDVELGITWAYNNSSGTESGAIVDQDGLKHYRIWFEDAGVAGTETEILLDFDDVYIEVIVQYDLHHFDVTINPAEINYGEFSSIGIRAKDEYGNELVLDEEITPDTPITIIADKDGYGHFELAGQAGKIIPRNTVKGTRVELTSAQKNKNRALTGKIKNEVINTPSEPFECTYGELFNGLRFVADGIEPVDNVTVSFTVTATDKPIALGNGILNLTAKGCPVVVLSDSTITPGDTIDVMIKKKINETTFVDYPAGQMFHIGITQGEMQGDLLINGERKKSDEPVTMPIKFIADTSLEMDSTELTIQGYPVVIVENPSDENARIINNGNIETNNSTNQKKYYAVKALTGETCSNLTDLKIGKYSIELIPNLSPEIWPTFLRKNDGSASLDRYGYNPTLKNIKIKVKDVFGKPVINKEIILKTEFIEQSGGHKHEADGSQTILPQSKQGLFYWSNNQGFKLSGNELRGIFTDNNGEIAVDSFTGTYYSGEYIMKAMAASKQTVFDTTKLWVRVPSLLDFKSLPNPYWTFSQKNSGTANHFNNNWCTFELATGLPFLLQDFYEMMKEEGAEFVFSLNDMSLPWGGSFDIDGKWNEILPDDKQSHNFHRVGLSVDFNPNGLKNPEKHYVAAFYRLKEFVKDYKCNNIYEGVDGPIHFEFDFNDSYSQ